MIGKVATNHKAPLVRVDSERWLQAVRRFSNATNERTAIVNYLPNSGVGDNAIVIDYNWAKSVSSALVLANFNSLPLDWTARLSIGGTNMSFFILKQLPILPPEAYLKQSKCGKHFVELIIPKVLELTYTSHELEGFARDLGYEGGPFTWDDGRRHRLRSEIDAIYAEMYGLDRSDLEHILDAPGTQRVLPNTEEKGDRSIRGIPHPALRPRCL